MKIIIEYERHRIENVNHRIRIPGVNTFLLVLVFIKEVMSHSILFILYYSIQIDVFHASENICLNKRIGFL